MVVFSLAGGPSAQSHPIDTHPRRTALPRIRLAWHDPNRLFGIGLGLATIRQDVSRFFADLGVAVEWDVVGRSNTIDLTILLRGEPPPSWGGRRDVMGAVLGKAIPRQNVLVILSNVQRTMGFEPGPASGFTPLQNVEVARALARVLAHEIVHAVAPAHPHASEGLMHRSQTRASLLKQPDLDPGCREAVVAALLATQLAQLSDARGPDGHKDIS